MKYFLVLVSLDEDTADKETLNSIFDIEAFDFENKEHIEWIKNYIKDIANLPELGLSLLTISDITPEQLEQAIETLKNQLE